MSHQSDKLTVSKEEYAILRSKVTELNSEKDKLNHQLKQSQEELKMAHLSNERDRIKLTQLISWREDENTLIKAIQRIKSGTVDVESEKNFEDPFDQIQSIVVFQNEELKKLRSKLMKQVDNIEILVEMVLKNNDREMYHSSDKAISMEAVKEPLEKLKYPVPCSEESQNNDRFEQKVMLLNKNQEINQKDFVYSIRNDDVSNVRSGDVFSAQLSSHMSLTSSNEPRTLRTESETSGYSLARFTHQLTTNPRSPLELQSREASYFNSQPAWPARKEDTMRSTSVKTISDPNRRMQDSSTERRECPWCQGLFSVATTAEQDQFNKHIDVHIAEDDREKMK